MSILLERFMVLVGLAKEVDEEEDDKKKKKGYLETMPQQTTFMPPPMNTMRETSGGNHQNVNFQQSMDMTPPPYSMAGGYGLQEPMASNEAGVTFLNF